MTIMTDQTAYRHDPTRWQAPLDDITARFDQIRDDALACIQRRADLIVTAQAEFAAAGIDTAVIYVRGTNVPFGPGEHVVVWDNYHTSVRGEALHDVSAIPVSQIQGDGEPQWGPYSHVSGWASIARGRYASVVADGEICLVAKVPGVDEAPGHARAVARLRRLATAEGMRVSVRGRAVTLKSPMNDVVHEGDVNSTYIWLMGIDPTAARYVDPLKSDAA